MLVYSLISSRKAYHPTLTLTGPVHSCAISTPRRAYSPAAVSAHRTYRTHCHLCPTKYSFSPESSEAFCSRFGASNLSYTLPSLSYQVLIFTPVKWSIWGQGHNILTMPQDWEGRNMIFLWKFCTKRDSKPNGRQRHRQSATFWPLRHVPLYYPSIYRTICVPENVYF